MPHLDADADRHLHALCELLAIPSISTDPAHAPDMRRAAGWLAARLAFAGGRVVETGGHPVVLAEWLGKPGAPTILVYGHYDVQPPGELAAWTSPPFEPTVRNGRVYARGATDDKGPMLVAVLLAAALHEQAGELPLNVRFLLEGEEEVGSPSLPRFLRERRAQLSADLVVSADGAMWRPDEPSIAIASRGSLTLDLELTGAATDLHSGRHGGAVENPLHALAAIVAGLHDDAGRVAVEGFYDDVVELDHAERAAIAGIRFDDESYRAGIGVPALSGEPGYTTLERLWTRPTLEVNALAGGGPYTVIPRAARAHVTCRLVPDQQPERVLAAIERHVRERYPPGVTLALTPRGEGTPAYSLAAAHPALAAGLAALRSVYPDQEPLAVRMGGTLPAATMLEQELGLKTLMFSFSTADEQLHAPDEFFRLSRLDEGMRAWAQLWRGLAVGGLPIDRGLHRLLDT